METTYEHLILNNRIWVDHKLIDDPNHFKEIRKQKKPSILWIGCSDNCTSIEEITSTSGDILIHHNIANMVVHNDMNMLSVLDYAINTLKVSQIVVCGHYGCSGIKAAMENKELGIVDHWFSLIRDVYRLHQKELESIEDSYTRWKRFVELNVLEQMLDLSKTTIIKNALKERKLEVNGCVFDSGSGLIHNLGTLFKV